MASTLKRKRTNSPEFMARERSNPPLPGLSSDVILTVFTHPSLSGNNYRFQRMGDVAVQYAIARILWQRGDEEPEKGIEVEFATLNSEENLADWARQYRLRERLRYGPDAASSVDKPTELANIFKAYAGAVDHELGPIALVNWIEKVITIPYSPEAALPPPPPQPAGNAPTPPPPPGGRPGGFIAYLNEAGQRLRHKVEFVPESTGPAHNLVWTMKCLIDGAERGIGNGTSKQAAKEDAARKTCYIMGWNPK
ncbi:hypothetical protein EXIGLDRAFT_716771 [Exidia glandulosa HHB12029]|uniref:Uncharacterized protein n=1 Tax=Exidia glandulosa HHB12029 TaxID=1314781 RepID=A0A165IRY6_EXIGL|nr:hypothetical protein EXIGLDRAFT_716771 [Exidia glandulosa HHB12029]